jgi:hypothetical protein
VVAPAPAEVRVEDNRARFTLPAHSAAALTLR